MGHFIGVGEKSFYVEDDGTVWGTADKKVRYDPETYKPIPADEINDDLASGSVQKMNGDDMNGYAPEDIEELIELRRQELNGMPWPKLKKLHAETCPDVEGNVKKPDAVENILKKEFS